MALEFIADHDLKLNYNLAKIVSDQTYLITNVLGYITNPMIKKGEDVNFFADFFDLYGL